MGRSVYTGTDRRASVRFPFNAAVQVSYEGQTFDARGTDFNDDAISIIHNNEIPVGAAVELSVVDELGNNISFLGEVFRAIENAQEGGFTMVIHRTPEDPEAK